MKSSGFFVNLNYKDTLNVGKHLDYIKLGPRGDKRISKFDKNKAVQVVTVDFIQKINTTGAPSKGLKNALVGVVIFSDFE